MAYEFKLPDIGEGIVEGEVVRWLIQTGQEIDEDQPMVEVMTDKATVEIPSPVKGTVVECRGNEGALVEVGATLVVIETGEKKNVPSQDSSNRKVSSRRSNKVSIARRHGSQSQILATPAIRRRAQQMKIDLAQITGTGPGGRITEQDLANFQTQIAAGKAPVNMYGSVERVAYHGVRRSIGDHMVQATSSIPHFTYVEEVDVTNLVRMRQRAQGEKEFQGIRLTYLPYILKALVFELIRYPYLNACLDLESGEIELRKYYNIGVATQSKEGLVVPVIRSVDQKSLLELAQEIAHVSHLARQGELKLEHLQGGTFTVTSLGALGGIGATPIINHPEVAILGVHKIAPRAVVRSGQIVIREIMHLSLSQDHRIVDGSVGAHFLHQVIAHLEEPETWVKDADL